MARLMILFALFVGPAFASPPSSGFVERDPTSISPVIAEIIDGVSRPVHGIRDNGPCGETRPCVGIVTPETIPAVPVPAPVWFMVTLLAAGWFCGRMDKRARRRKMGR